MPTIALYTQTLFTYLKLKIMRVLKLLPLLLSMILLTACNSNDDEMNLTISEGLHGSWTLKEATYFMNSKQYKKGQIVYTFTLDKVTVNTTIANPPLIPQGTYNYTYDTDSKTITIDGIKYGFKLKGLELDIAEPKAYIDAGGFFHFVKVKN
jgi:hypothetical protein